MIPFKAYLRMPRSRLLPSALLVLLPWAATAACAGGDNPRREVEENPATPSVESTDPGESVSAEVETGADRCGKPDGRISAEGVGAVLIGMSADAVRSLCPGARDTTLQIEGMEEHALSVTEAPGHPLVEIQEGSVWRITVRAPGPTTDDGVAVGGGVAPLLEVGELTIASGEGGRYLMTPERCGTSVRISSLSGANGDPTLDQLRKSPDDWIVERVLVTGECP